MNIKWDNKGRMTFLSPYKVKVDNIQFTFPKGFKSDGVSIPFFVQWFGDPYEAKTLNGALVHDGLYGKQGWYQIGKLYYQLPRPNIDEIFRQIMIHDKVGAFKLWTYWIMVRLFGWWPFYVTPFLRRLFKKKPKNVKIISVKIIK